MLYVKNRFSINAMSALLTIIVLALTAFFVSLLPIHRMDSMRCLINYTTFDSGPQRMGHKLMLFLIAASGLLVLPLCRAVRTLLDAGASRLAGTIQGLRQLPVWAFALLLPVVVIAYQRPGKDQLLLGIALSLIFVLLGARLAQNRMARGLAIAVLAAYAALLLLPGFYGFFTFGKILDQCALHYYGLFGLVPILVQSSTDILSRTSVFYGLWPQTILAVIQHRGRPLHMGDYVLAVQWAQVAFATLSLASYRRIAPKAIIWPLFCMTLWVPWISTAGPSMLAPTSSGLRFFGYALSVFALISAKDLRRHALALVLGATAGFCLLYNLETGICSSLGLFAYILLGERANHIMRLITALLLFVVGVFLSGFTFCIFFRVGLGYWPGTTIGRLFAFIGNFNAGFGGLPLYFEILLLPLLAYPIYLIIRMTGIWFVKGLSNRMRFKFSISVMLLIWFAYYFNRAHHWNLWTHMFLFTFLIVDLTPWRLSRIKVGASGLDAWRPLKMPLGPLILILILGPASVNEGLTQSKVAWKSLMERIASERVSTEESTFSGVWVGADCAQDLRAKSAVLREFARAGKVVFAGPNQMLLILETGIIVPMAGQDIFNDSFTEAYYWRMVGELQNYSPDAVLLASETPCTASTLTRTNFNSALEKQLAPSYAQRQFVSGWNVLVKR
jgi:hypothetical protein